MVLVSVVLFEGLGVGVIYYYVKYFLVEFCDVFFVNDWM